MSGEMGNGKSKNNIPPPPPPPPPLKTLSSERLPKLKTKELFSRNSPAQNPSKKVGNAKQSKLPKKGASKQTPAVGSKQSPFKVSNQQQSSRPETMKVSPLPQSTMNTTPSSNISIQDESSEDKMPMIAPSRKKNAESASVMEIVRNDVPFFDEENCTDSEDEFAFPCCLQPNSPRYPPNPRPYREWDPSFLPSSTNIPTSIGRKCRRCGNPVYVAELYMSSRGVYHSECYKCCLCGKTLDSWSVSEYKGEVFCKGCYRRNFGTHGCGFGVGAGVLQTP